MSLRKITTLATIGLLSLILIWCAGCVTSTPTPTAPPTTPAPTTPVPTTPPPTLPAPPASTPALQLPALAGTPVPLPWGPITPENAADIVELAMWDKGRVQEVTYSPDGRLLAVGTTVGIWFYDATTLEQLRFIETDSWVSGLAFTSDSTMLFTRMGDSILAWWDVPTGERLGSRGGGTWPAVFFLDGARLAAVPGGSAGQWVEVWDLEGGERVRVMGPHGDDVLSLAFSSDGLLLASGSRDHTIRLWDVRTGNLVQTLEGHAGPVASLAFSPDGLLLASASSSPSDSVRLWDVGAGSILWTLEGQTGSASLAFSPDGSVLATGAPGAVRLWDTRTGVCLHFIRQASNDVTFSPDGATLVFGGGDGTVRLWDMETEAIADTLEGYKESLSGLAVSPDGRVFVSSFSEIEMRDIKTGQVVRTLEAPQALFLTLSTDSTILAASTKDAIVVWDAETGQRVQTLPGGNGRWPPIRALTLAPDGTVESIRDSDANSIIGLTFSPDGTKGASSTRDGAVQVWHTLPPYTHTLEMIGQTAGVVAFSPDGGTVAAGGSDDGRVRLWDAETNEELCSLEGHTAEVLSVAFSPNGMVLASGAKDGTVRLWNAKTGQPLHTLDTPLAGLVAFSPDGSLLVLGCEDGSVRLWGLPPMD